MNSYFEESVKKLRFLRLLILDQKTLPLNLFAVRRMISAPVAKKSRVSRLAFKLSSDKANIAACRVVELGSQEVYVTGKIFAP